MANNRTGISPILVSYSEILAIVGDIVRIKVPEEESGNGISPCLEDLAVLEAVDGNLSLAQVIGIKRDVVALQVFNGTRGISTNSIVRFLGHPMQASYSGNIFGRVFRGTGEPIDGGPDLSNDPKVTIGGPSVNPMRRVLASKMIRTNVPMIDVFNCLVESQKIPIFSVSGEPFNQLLARIGIQADADVIVFGGMGLIFDDYYFFRKAFEEAGMFTRTVMFVNQASDPVVERLLIPDLALAVAENIAVDERKRVLVLLSDMTAFADALKEVSIAMDQVPANRGYPVPFQGGEDLVTFYETPGYRSWDPSWIVASSFAIFFAMILSDAGYALVLAAILFLARNKLGRSAGGRRFRLLMSGVLAVAFVYGVLAGSYFGIEPSQNSLLGALHLLHLQDTASMMAISLVVGCAHLIMANAASSLHATSLAGKLKPIGWIAVILSGLFLFLSRGTQAEQVMWKIGSGFIAGGLMLIILFGSNRQVKSFSSALLRLLDGLGSLFDISKIFGDALSYLRLFALGLASASLAVTFNQIASQIGKNIPGLGILLAIIILLVGHALNLLLGIISGFVHGLRLNYIEFFKWAISEEGYPFIAFAKRRLNRE